MAWRSQRHSPISGAPRTRARGVDLDTAPLAQAHS
jgi:hypothetical protein